jgi:hypothetical protein
MGVLLCLVIALPASISMLDERSVVERRLGVHPHTAIRFLLTDCSAIQAYERGKSNLLVFHISSVFVLDVI